MTRLLLPAAFALMFSTYALADGATTTFTDPTEQAFAVQVPKGWPAKGGIARSSPTDGKFWISVTTGDRSTIMFIGDPSIPSFGQHTGVGPMGRPMPFLKGTVEAPYENGQQFAVDYGKGVLPHLCANLQLQGTQPEPGLAQQAAAQAAALAQEIGVNMPPPEMDGGSATFTCQTNSRSLVARISAVTVISHSRANDNWRVAAIMGFSTPAGLENKAQALLMAMKGSFKWNADWRARQADAVRQSLAQNQQNYQYGSAMIARQAQINSQILYSQYQSTTNMMTNNHNAFMQQMNNQRDSRNAAFAQHMYDKSVGQQNEMMYIQNQQCIHRVYNQPGNLCNVSVQH